MSAHGESKPPSRCNGRQLVRTSSARNSVQRHTSARLVAATPSRDATTHASQLKILTAPQVVQRSPSLSREASPPRLRSSPPRSQRRSPASRSRLVTAVASLAPSRTSLRQTPPPNASLEAPPQRKAPSLHERSHATNGWSGQYGPPKSASPPPIGYVALEQMSTQASQCSTTGTPLPVPLSQAFSVPSDSEASGVTILPPSTSSPSKAARIIDENDPNIFTRLQELGNDRESLMIRLGEVFASVDRGHLGYISREDAVMVLRRVFAMHLPSLPYSCTVDEAQLRNLLKTFGVYGPDDAISYETLLELCMRKIASLRDFFAPREVLRAMQQVSRAAPRLKDQYDKFEFRSKDSLGKVYVCRDTCTREVRSCRQIRKDKACLPIDQIRLHLARLTQVQHIGMPQVHSFVEDFHNFYILSALALGVEVMDRIQDALQQSQVLTESWVAGIIKQVLEVLAWCHGQATGPVIHGDLKPESILLTAEERPRVSLINMGLQAPFNSQPLGKILSPNSLSPSGSEEVVQEALPLSAMPEILAPEVWRRDCGPRCDVWSCGCLLFLLVTGCLPFGPNLALPDLGRMIIAGEPDWRLFRHVSTSVLSLCRRMLSRDDLVRPSARECLRHPWFGSCSGDSHNSRELRLETISSLMQFHTRAKLQQVLMNLIAAELKVSDLRRLPSAFASYDTAGTGLLAAKEFEEVLTVLGVMPESVAQVLHALIPDQLSKVPYTVFVAGCVDLVDDKLDHMLWKVFSLVDEDCTGEVGTIEIEHFLAGVAGSVSSPTCAIDVASSNGHGGSHSGTKEEKRYPATDMERYLRGVLPPSFDAIEAVARMARGRNYVVFEDLKLFVLGILQASHTSTVALCAPP